MTWARCPIYFVSCRKNRGWPFFFFPFLISRRGKMKLKKKGTIRSERDSRKQISHFVTKKNKPKNKRKWTTGFVLFLQTKTPMIFQRSNRDTTENSVQPEANGTNSHPSTSYFFFPSSSSSSSYRTILVWLCFLNEWRFVSYLAKFSILNENFQKSTNK